MPGNQLFEYAVIRVVPRPEREEFLNVGVILYCAGEKYLQMKFTLDHQRLTSFFPDINISDLEIHLAAFKEICCGTNELSPIAKLDNASRFRWLTAMRSTIVQTSKVHPGLCDDPEQTLNKLHEQLVIQ
jgi:hypothetical protein